MASPEAKNYWVLRMGEANRLATRAYADNFVGLRFADIDLTKYRQLPRKDFLEKVKPLLSKAFPEGSKGYVAAAAGQLFRFSALMKVGDVVLVPHTNEGKLYAGVLESDYRYVSGPDEEDHFWHQRSVSWLKEIPIDSMSDALRNSAGSIMTSFSVSGHAEEIALLISDGGAVTAGGEAIENAKEFGLESHLEDFIVHNWDNLPLSKHYEIYKDEDGLIGKQYVVDVGRIDILAKSKDGKEWLVIELKKGKTGDEVVGQVLRYMGYIKAELANESETVRGLLVAGSDDKKIQYAIVNLPNVKFMTYAVDFKLKS